MIDDDDMHRNVCRDLHIKVFLQVFLDAECTSLFQRHHLYSLCVYISLLESRKIILIPEESIAKLQHRTVVQGA